MREDLMRELRRVTEEEEQLLAGGQVDKSLYTSGGGFLIDSDKLLAKGKLITVRPHTPVGGGGHRHRDAVLLEQLQKFPGKTLHFSVNGERGPIFRLPGRGLCLIILPRNP